MEWEGKFGPTLRHWRNLLDETNNIIGCSRHCTAVKFFMITLWLQQLRSKLWNSGDGFSWGEKREWALEASTDFDKIVADSGESFRRWGWLARGSGRRRRRWWWRRWSEKVGDTAENKREVFLDAVIDGGERRRWRGVGGGAVKIGRFCVRVVGLEEPRHFFCIF